MAVSKTIAGVVLAGGRSSRMGRDKAQLIYRDQALMHYMADLLEQAGLEKVYISGKNVGAAPYSFVPDHEAHRGPAQAIQHCLTFLHKQGIKAALFVPVDMPLLTPDILKRLLEKSESGYFEGSALPIVLPCGVDIQPCNAVKDIIKLLGIRPIEHTYHQEMQNINTPEDWQRLTRA